MKIPGEVLSQPSLTSSHILTASPYTLIYVHTLVEIMATCIDSTVDQILIITVHGTKTSLSSYNAPLLQRNFTFFSKSRIQFPGNVTGFNHTAKIQKCVHNSGAEHQVCLQCGGLNKFLEWRGINHACKEVKLRYGYSYHIHLNFSITEPAIEAAFACVQ